LLSDEELVIRWLPGNGDQLVLAFTGVEHGFGGLPMDEFLGSASNHARNHVLFISDMQKSWYSKKGISVRIRNFVLQFIAEKQINATTAIGNSMGGYGAIMMAGLLDLKAVAAFSPQISMHPHVIDEKRWAKFRPSFGRELLLSVAPIVSFAKTHFFVFFGAESTRDVGQNLLLKPAKNLTVRVLKDCNHNAAQVLKRKNILAPLLRRIIDDDTTGIDDLLAGQIQIPQGAETQ